MAQERVGHSQAMTPAQRPCPVHRRHSCLEYPCQGRVPTAALRGKAPGGGGSAAPLGVPRSECLLTPAEDCRIPDLIHSVVGLDDGEESRWPQWPQAGGLLASPKNLASLHLAPELYLPASRTTLGRTPTPIPLRGSGADVGRGRKLVA